MANVIAIILGIVKAIPIVDTWFQQLIAAYIMSQTASTKAAIVDAASLAARAVTEADRYAASDAWQKALSRKREVSA